MFNRTTRLARSAFAVLAAGLVTTAAAVAFGATSASAAPAAPFAGNLFADVDAGGTLTAGGGALGVTHLGTGRYEVAFNKNVNHCAYVATTVNAYSQALQAYTAGGHLGSHDVYVETKNQGGGLTDGPFSLVVDCGGPGMSYAVVGYSGNLVRSTPFVSLTSLGTGRYDVRFPSKVSGCAFLAAVGDPGHALVYNPSGVYTGSGANPHVVYIETKNTGGGLTAGVPFHLAVICPGAPETRVAVVGADGAISRGSALTSSFEAATGQYVVASNVPVGACAVVATRGSTGTAVPFTPATVEVTAGPAFNTYGIQVRDLLFFGGGFDSQAFHTALVC
jgi:hypothetical protein